MSSEWVNISPIKNRIKRFAREKRKCRATNALNQMTASCEGCLQSAYAILLSRCIVSPAHRFYKIEICSTNQRNATQDQMANRPFWGHWNTNYCGAPLWDGVQRDSRRELNGSRFWKCPFSYEDNYEGASVSRACRFIPGIRCWSFYIAFYSRHDKRNNMKRPSTDTNRFAKDVYARCAKWKSFGWFERKTEDVQLCTHFWMVLYHMWLWFNVLDMNNSFLFSISELFVLSSSFSIHRCRDAHRARSQYVNATDQHGMGR